MNSSRLKVRYTIEPYGTEQEIEVNLKDCSDVEEAIECIERDITVDFNYEVGWSHDLEDIEEQVVRTNLMGVKK